MSDLNLPSLKPDTYTGELFINGVSMHTYGWNVLDLRLLWVGQALRGTDRVLPGVRGVLPFRRRKTVFQAPLPMLITGTSDMFGGPPVSGVQEQLQANIEYLKTNVLEPTNVGDGTLPADLFMPDGTQLEADVHVLGFTPAQWHPYHVGGILDLSIPSGGFS